MFGMFTYNWLIFIVNVAKYVILNVAQYVILNVDKYFILNVVKYTIYGSCALRLINLFQCASRNVLDLYLDLKRQKKTSTI